MVYKGYSWIVYFFIVSLIKIGTRKSQLALWQANHVAGLLKRTDHRLVVELVEITTEGDRFLHAPLSQAGGKGLFLKELEEALYRGEIDLAVHSMKDVTVTLPHGLHIAAILKRHDVRDALVSNNGIVLDELPRGAVVGTCSLRRQCLIGHHYPHLEVKNIRGNVNTRLAKLDNQEFDAILLAAAGLKRLELEHRVTEFLDEEKFVPAVGQGAIGVECRIDDDWVNASLSALNDPLSALCVTTERRVNERLGGGCHVPLAVYARVEKQNIQLFAFAGLPDGTEVVSVLHTGQISNPVLASEQMADKLIKNGVLKVIASINERS